MTSASARIARRSVCAALLGVPLVGSAQQRRSLKDPMRLGVDVALAASGLARALQTAFGRDTGVAVKLEPRPSAAVLEALDAGELDASLTNAPALEQKLFDAGLAHDRRPIASGAFVLVGPAPTTIKGRKVPDPAATSGERDIAAALAKVRDAGANGVVFLSANDGSGAHLGELALWRAAQIAPAAPWHAVVAPGASHHALLRERGAYGIVERGAWLASAARGGAPIVVLVDADPRQAAPVHFMRSFRTSHPAARLFVQWIDGPKGRRVAAGVRGYRAA